MASSSLFYSSTLSQNPCPIFKPKPKLFILTPKLSNFTSTPQNSSPIIKPKVSIFTPKASIFTPNSTSCPKIKPKISIFTPKVSVFTLKDSIFTAKDSIFTSNSSFCTKFGYKKLLLWKTHVGNTEREVNEFLVGEDSAEFELSKQKIKSWVYFTGILGVVLLILDVVWIDNSTGFGKSFIDAISSLTDSPEVVMLSLILIFAVVHSGLASLRDGGEKLIGERAYRVLFAGVSLPLAVSTIVYFINHRYDGLQLWQLQSVPGLHQFVWLSNFISFFFLYPSTFNLLEVAAVDKPKMHLWETGIMRITRHPQMVGQVMWCLAHTLWIGNSVAVAASVGLIGHHLFGAWNGDRRLAVRHGKAFEVVKSRTSIIPFAAILDGRQKLPNDYYKEFIRLPYLTITFLTLGAYFAHPLMQASSYGLHW